MLLGKHFYDILRANSENTSKICPCAERDYKTKLLYCSYDGVKVNRVFRVSRNKVTLWIKRMILGIKLILICYRLLTKMTASSPGCMSIRLFKYLVSLTHRPLGHLLRCR